jgi:hypothetical protein
MKSTEYWVFDYFAIALPLATAIALPAVMKIKPYWANGGQVFIRK